MRQKSILLPYKDKKILIQDRTGHKPPPWGYFGGTIEEGETPIEALIREIEEELGIKISKQEVKFIGVYEFQKYEVILNAYLWKVNINESEFKINEGRGYKYIDLSEAKKLLDEVDFSVFEDAMQKI